MAKVPNSVELILDTVSFKIPPSLPPPLDTFPLLNFLRIYALVKINVKSEIII